MAIGYSRTKRDFDQRAGYLALKGREWLGEVEQFKALLDSLTVSDLVSLGYTEDEASTFKSAFTDLDNLRKVAVGQQAQPASNNFLYFSSRLTGVQ